MTDRELESLIGTILRTGVLTAALIVAASGVLFLAHHHADPPRYATFETESASLRTIPGIIRSAMNLRTEALIQLGLLLLIATPIARVALAAAGFYLEGDRLYLAVSTIVLAILIFSLTRST